MRHASVLACLSLVALPACSLLDWSGLTQDSSSNGGAPGTGGSAGQGNAGQGNAGQGNAGQGGMGATGGAPDGGVPEGGQGNSSGAGGQGGVNSGGEGGEGGGGESGAGGSGAPPVFELLETSPLAGEMEVDPTTDVVLTFGADMAKGTGNVTVHIGDDQVFEAFAVQDSRVQIDGRVVTIDLDGVLGGELEVEVTIDAGALRFLAGDPFAGLAETPLEFSTAQVEPPGGVGDGLVLWLDASLKGSLKIDGGGVRVWGDCSGLGHNVQQNNAASQPFAVVEGLGGKDVLRFDGSYLEYANEDGALDLTDATVLVLASPRYNNMGPNPGLLAVAGPGAAHRMSVHLQGDLGGVVSFDFVNTEVGDYELTANEFYLTEFWWQAGVHRQAVNGMRVHEGESEWNTGAPQQPLRIGAKLPNAELLDGDIAEVLVYNRALSDAELLALQAYVAMRWGDPF